MRSSIATARIAHAAGAPLKQMAIRRMSAAGNTQYDYVVNCTDITDTQIYPPCPQNDEIDKRVSPICWGANMSCTPGTYVYAEVGVDAVDGGLDEPYYITPTDNYTWKVIGELLREPLPPPVPAPVLPPNH